MTKDKDSDEWLASLADENALTEILEAKDGRLLALGKAFVTDLEDDLLDWTWAACWDGKPFSEVMCLLGDLGASLDEASGGAAWMLQAVTQLQEHEPYTLRGKGTPRRLADLLDGAGRNDAAAARGFVRSVLLRQKEEPSS